MLRDDGAAVGPGASSPFNYRPINFLDDELKAASSAADSSFFEEFCRSLKALAQKFDSLTSAADANSVKARLEELTYKFESKTEQMRSQCQQLEHARDLLQTKV